MPNALACLIRFLHEAYYTSAHVQLSLSIIIKLQTQYTSPNTYMGAKN